MRGGEEKFSRNLLRARDKSRTDRSTARTVKIALRADAVLKKRGLGAELVAGTDGDWVELLRMGLGRGSLRTIRQYAYAWLRLELWFERRTITLRRSKSVPRKNWKPPSGTTRYYRCRHSRLLVTFGA
jgi:hypothetical protein